jgi:nucleoside 2-deoxyribosyltransferase
VIKTAHLWEPVIIPPLPPRSLNPPEAPKISKRKECMYRIYLAGRQEDRLAIQEIMGMLVDDGHIVTSRWLKTNHFMTDEQAALLPQYMRNSERRRLAEEDFEDIDRADFFILYKPELSHRNTTGGHHVETGYAIALRKRIIVIGKRENVFHWCRNVAFVETPGAMIGALNAYDIIDSMP